MPKKNEPKRLTAAQSELAAEYYPFIRKHIKPVVAAYPQYEDDLRSAANECLVNSARCYNGQIKFATYLKFKLEYAIKDCLRLVCKQGMTRVPVANKGVTMGYIRDDDSSAYAYESQDIPRLVDRDFLLKVMNGLPQVQKDVCRYVFVDGLAQREAATRVGLSQSRISCLLQEAVDRMRQAAEYADLTA